MNQRLIAALALSLIVCVPRAPGQTTEEIRQILDGIDDTRGLAQINKRIDGAPPEERRKILGSLIQIVDEVVAVPLTERQSNNYRVSQVARVLMDSGDEAAILSAFANNLPNLSPSAQIAAAAALATCRNSLGLEAIEKVAQETMSRIPEDIALDAPEDVKRNANDVAISFFELLREMAGSANPAGKITAKQLRDQFADLAGDSILRGQVLQALDVELQPLFAQPSQPPQNAAPSQIPSPSARNEIPKPPPLTETPILAKPDAEKPKTLLYVVLGLLAVAIFVVVLRKAREPQRSKPRR